VADWESDFIFVLDLMFKQIYLYILECSDGTYYTGVSNNLEKRVLEHQSGVNAKAYTYSRRPVKLVYHIVFNDFNQAFEVETKIKKWSSKKKKALIEGDFDLLKVLAKKKFSK